MAPLLHGLGYQPVVLGVSQSAASVPRKSDGQHQAPLPTLISNTEDHEVSCSYETMKADETNPENANEAVLEEIDQPHLVAQKKSRKKRLLLGSPSPFQERVDPSANEFRHIHDLLSTKHEKREMPSNIPPPSQTVAGCGEVNFVLEALVRTLISTHTHMNNANRAIKNVCSTYPVFQEGDFAGSVDWNTVRLLGAEKLANAIRPAGKAVTTSKAIISMLQSVKSENDMKRTLLQDGHLHLALSQATKRTRSEILGARAYEMLETDSDFLTLDYLHLEPPQTVFGRLQEFSGVGVKTAACILLFCFQYPAFAVDTHVWRLCKLLKWVPETATRDQTFFHLDRVVPDELKYGLHQLFIAHGKECVRCGLKGKEGSSSWDGSDCILEHLVDRKVLHAVKKRKPAEAIPETTLAKK